MCMAKATVSSFGDSRSGYVFPVGSIGQEELISNQQRRTLSELISRNIEDEDEREGRLASLDDLTVREAESAIFEFLTASWK